MICKKCGTPMKTILGLYLFCEFCEEFYHKDSTGITLLELDEDTEIKISPTGVLISQDKGRDVVFLEKKKAKQLAEIILKIKECR